MTVAAEQREHRVADREREREREIKRGRETSLDTTVWYRMERECLEGNDLDSDGPEPLATVGQLSSPRFASFFEPSLCTRGDPLRRLRRPTSIYEQRFSTAILPSLSLRTLVCVTRLPFSRQTHLELECVYMCVCVFSHRGFSPRRRNEGRNSNNTPHSLEIGRAGKPSLAYLFI